LLLVVVHGVKTFQKQTTTQISFPVSHCVRLSLVRALSLSC
jgi:hypothetical protein